MGYVNLKKKKQKRRCSYDITLILSNILQTIIITVKNLPLHFALLAHNDADRGKIFHSFSLEQGFVIFIQIQPEYKGQFSNDSFMKKKKSKNPYAKSNSLLCLIIFNSVFWKAESAYFTFYHTL